MTFPVELLKCPRCGGNVSADGTADGTGPGRGELVCVGCGRRSATAPGGFLDMLREPDRPDPTAPTPAQKLMESTAYVRVYETLRPFFVRLFAGPGAAAPSPAEEFELYREILCLDGAEGTLLDLSCGAGYFTLRIARAAPAATVVGLDISAAMLQRAAATDREHRVHWMRGDVRGLPLRAASFDAVSNPGSLHLYADPDAAFREVFRLLKPGGIYTASTFAAVERRSSRVAADLLGVRRTDLAALPDDLARAGFEDYRLRTFGDAFVVAVRRPG